MNAARDGDTVQLAPGTFRETVELKTGVRVVGGPSVIDATGLDHGVTANASVTCCASIERVAVRNASSQGILIVGAQGVQVKDCEISGSGAQGIRARDSDVAITASRILDNVNAAGLLVDGGRTALKANVFRNNLGVGSIRIMHGAQVTSDGDQVLDGLVSGIALDGGNDPADLVPPRLSMKGGVVRNCAEHGVVVRDGGALRMEGSQLLGNGVDGLRAEDGASISVERSVIRSNGAAGGSHGVTLMHGASGTIEESQVTDNANTGVLVIAGVDLADQRRSSVRMERNVVSGNAAGLQAINSDASSRRDAFDGNLFGVVLSYGASLDLAGGSISWNGINGLMTSDPNEFFFCSNAECTSFLLVQATVSWIVDDTRVEGNQAFGLAVNGGRGMVRRSILSRNGTDGLNMNAAYDVHLPGGGIEQVIVPGVLGLRQSTISGNGRWGVQVLGPSTFDMGASGDGRNSCVGNVAGAVANFTNPGTVIPAEGNWWGTVDVSAIGAMMIGPVDFVPFLGSPPR